MDYCICFLYFSIYYVNMKINFIDASLCHFMIHGIGNKCLEESLVLSSQEVKMNEMTTCKLLDNLLKKIPHEASWHYVHDIDLSYNEMFSFTQKVFENRDTFVSMSKNMAKHLFNQGVSKNVRSGIVYMAYLQGILVDDKEVDAIGVFKSEKTDTFLKVNYEGGIYSLSSVKGMGCIDKGCLIMNAESENGYLISLFNSKKKSDVKYWNEDFLGSRLINDNNYKTNRVVELCGTFITTNEAIAKTDKANMIDRVLSAMTLGETSFEEITNVVFDEEKIRQQFSEYCQKQANLDEDKLDCIFVPNIEKIGKELKKYRNKSKLMLDDDFEVLIKGGEENIVKGYDQDKGLSYYKLYFREEK